MVLCVKDTGKREILYYSIKCRRTQNFNVIELNFIWSLKEWRVIIRFLLFVYINWYATIITIYFASNHGFILKTMQFLFIYLFLQYQFLFIFSILHICLILFKSCIRQNRTSYSFIIIVYMKWKSIVFLLFNK